MIDMTLVEGGLGFAPAGRVKQAVVHRQTLVRLSCVSASLSAYVSVDA